MTDKLLRNQQKQHAFGIMYGRDRARVVVGVDYGSQDRTCVVFGRQSGKTLLIESVDFTHAEIRVQEMIRRREQAQELARAHPDRPWAKRWCKSSGCGL